MVSLAIATVLLGPSKAIKLPCNSVTCRNLTRGFISSEQNLERNRLHYVENCSGVVQNGKHNRTGLEQNVSKRYMFTLLLRTVVESSEQFKTVLGW